MSQSHTWFATVADAKLIISWLQEAGAASLGSPLPDEDLPADGREFILHFPSIGPIAYWPDGIRLSDYPESSPRWRRAVIAKANQQKNPGRLWVDADHSATAGLKLPELRNGQHWVSGSLWFPGSGLRKTFPELSRVCGRFERWLSRFPIIYGSRKGDDVSRFSYQFRMSGFVQRVVALPEAYALLERGAFMVDHMTSPKAYSEFRRKLQLSGYLPLEP